MKNTPQYQAARNREIRTKVKLPRPDKKSLETPEPAAAAPEDNDRQLAGFGGFKPASFWT